MIVRISCILLVVLAVPGLRAQTPDTARTADLKRLIPNIASDQKQIWTFPARIFRNRNWALTLGVLAATAGLVAADSKDTPYFRRTTTFHGFNSVFTGNAMAAGIVLAPASLYVAGLIRKDSYAKQTAWLAGEALADTEILATVLKDADRRLRPVAVPLNGKFGDAWFESRGSLLAGSGGFPSGHAIAAFSVATVISRRYPHRRWVPFVAYGLAGVVGFSRVSLSAHFPSDVFMGAAMGYSVSRFTVLR